MNEIKSIYNTSELNALKETANEFGMSPDDFQKYHTLLGLENSNTLSINHLIGLIVNNLIKKEPGYVFVTAGLIPNEWVTLNRSEKQSLSAFVKKFVETHPHKYRINGAVNENINQYIVL